jgi:hypothetical protein
VGWRKSLFGVTLLEVPVPDWLAPPSAFKLCIKTHHGWIPHGAKLLTSWQEREEEQGAGAPQLPSRAHPQ